MQANRATTEQQNLEFLFYGLIFATPLVGLLFSSARLWFLGCQLLSLFAFYHWQSSNGITFFRFSGNDTCKRVFQPGNPDVELYVRIAFATIIVTALYFEGYLGDLIFAGATTFLIMSRFIIGKNLIDQLDTR